jgi:hypothetical protein
MVQRRHGGFRQKPHVHQADRQLAAKGAADAGTEVGTQDRSKVGGAVPQTAVIPGMACGYLPHTQTSPHIRATALDLTGYAVPP